MEPALTEVELLENLRRPLRETLCADFLVMDGVADEDEDELPAVVVRLPIDWRGTRDTDCGDARTEDRCETLALAPANCGLGVSLADTIPNSFALELWPEGDSSLVCACASC